MEPPQIYGGDSACFRWGLKSKKGLGIANQEDKPTIWKVMESCKYSLKTNETFRNLFPFTCLTFPSFFFSLLSTLTYLDRHGTKGVFSTEYHLDISEEDLIIF